MTEEEAKTKWCPFARRAEAAEVTVTEQQVDEYTSIGRLERGLVATNTGARCIASTCMVWRWVDAEKAYLGRSDALGFCGLAGRPS